MLHYNVWLDVDNINGGVLNSMADAVENSSIVLICMNEQYKQSYYCRLGQCQQRVSSFDVIRSLVEAGRSRMRVVVGRHTSFACLVERICD
jgi:hypothetical protein